MAIIIKIDCMNESNRVMINKSVENIQENNQVASSSHFNGMLIPRACYSRLHIYIYL